jgi:hypothetical protein
MLVGMVLAGFFSMVGGVHRMSVGDVGVVAGLFVVAGFVVLGRFAMMCRRVFMMFGGLMMMICSVVCHCDGTFL